MRSMGKRQIFFRFHRCLTGATPVLEKLPGWSTDISSVREFSDLPTNAQRYVKHIEAWLEVPVKWISVGPRREDIIEMRG